MSYEPTTWANGDIITATKLNNIESGVQSVSSSYTPTTWATGDIITATKLNNIEQGIANAGGGSSDFSTAQVRVLLQETSANVCLPFTIMDTFTCGFTGMTDETVTAYLKDGSVTCMIAGDFESVNVSGNASVDEYYNVIITGDCTITIS